MRFDELDLNFDSPLPPVLLAALVLVYDVEKGLCGLLVSTSAACSYVSSMGGKWLDDEGGSSKGSTRPLSLGFVRFGGASDPLALGETDPAS